MEVSKSYGKKLLLGYGFNHTELCFNASAMKANKQGYVDERLRLLGDSFSIYSFCIPAAALCRIYLPLLEYQHLVNRIGMSSGFCAPIAMTCPLNRQLVYGASD